MAGAAKRMQQRRGTASEWASLDPVLLAGELGVETDTGVVKVGDGVKAWGELEEIGGGGGTEAYVFEGPDTENVGDGAVTYDDTELRGRVGEIETALGGCTVRTDVPAGAVFTDTLYDDTNIRGLIAAKQDAGNYVVMSDTGVLTATNGKIANIKYSKVNNIVTVQLDGVISIEFKTRVWTPVWELPAGFAPKHNIFAVGVINTQPHEACMLSVKSWGSLEIAAMYTDSPANVTILGTITYVCA